ncbi:MAG: Xaa-Pro peptidase family protein [Paracoccaceae bacterium]|nr:Xaa-Pro peptidase family protein [Paracoccaceae bacterium]
MNFTGRTEELRRRLGEAGLDVAVITDDDSVYYFSGYCDYLHMDFGRPTILVVPRDGESILITPEMERDMAAEAVVDQVTLWNDGAGEEWRADLPGVLSGNIGIETDLMPPRVRNYIDTLVAPERLADVTPVIAAMRTVKSPQELEIARHAGQVAMAMMEAGRGAIGNGVAEYEVAMATSAAGTREAARILAEHYENGSMSPMTHFLQIMASGDQITKTHHRASTRIMRRGEPVFLCFCGMTNFHRFKLGFDRTFWIGEISDPRQAELYEVAVASQAAALAALRPGVTAESVHTAYADVIQQAGFAYPFRCGRATGFSFLETPELVFGDKTVLQPGMVFAVDGSVSEPGNFRAQVGDSVIVTEDGYEPITHHTKVLEEMVL